MLVGSSAIIAVKILAQISKIGFLPNACENVLQYEIDDKHEQVSFKAQSHFQEGSILMAILVMKLQSPQNSKNSCHSNQLVDSSDPC